MQEKVILQNHFPIKFHRKTAFRTNRAVYARSVLKAVFRSDGISL